MNDFLSNLVNLESRTVPYFTEISLCLGDYNLAGVNRGGMKDTKGLEEVFFNNFAFGVKRRNNLMFRTIGCDYCFWTIHFEIGHDF